MMPLGEFLDGQAQSCRNEVAACDGLGVLPESELGESEGEERRAREQVDNGAIGCRTCTLHPRARTIPHASRSTSGASSRRRERRKSRDEISERAGWRGTRRATSVETCKWYVSDAA